MALDESESHVRCAFTAALTTVYDVHFSEVAALQNEIQRQQGINKVQQKRIEELECHLHRMRRVLKSSKAKIRQQLYVHRKLKQLIEEHNIPIPYKEEEGTESVLSDDSTSLDKDGTSQLSYEQKVLVEDNSAISQESFNNAGCGKHGTCSQRDHSFAGANINSSTATIDLNSSSSEETENENEDDVIVLEEDAKLADLELQGHRNISDSPAREASSTNEGVQQQHDLNTGSTTHLQVLVEEEKSTQSKRKLPDLKGHLRLHALERPSKIKYKDICKHDGTTAHIKSDNSLGSPSPSSAPAHTELTAGHQDSSSPSPSLLCNPISPWKGLQVQTATSDVGQDSPCDDECEIVAEIPLTDSQLSLDVSQTIPPSLELLPVSTPHTAPLRKRSHVEAFHDHSDKEKPLPTPLGSPLLEPKHPGGYHITAEHTETRQNVASPSLILPKTPGVKVMSSMVLGNKDFFAGVQINKKARTVDDAETSDNDTTVPTCATTQTLLQSVEDKNREPEQSNSSVIHLHSVKQSPENISQERHNTLCLNEDEVVDDHSEQTRHARELAAKAGLPQYKYEAVIRNRADRNKLDGKECSECRAWYSGESGIHHNRRDHLKQTCRHKQLYHRQDSDPKMWDISFPNTEEL